jgi:hypothetical protein
MFGEINSFNRVLNTAVLINAKTSGVQTDDFGLLVHGVFTRSVISSLTLSNIIFPKPTVIKHLSDSSIQLYDLPSAYLIVRSLFESYTNIFYILNPGSTLEEKKLKYFLWIRHSLHERARMASFRGVENFKLKKEQIEIENINRHIKENLFYLSLPIEKQKYFNNPDHWTDLNITKRGIYAGFSENTVRFIYKLFSSYAHSESFSSMQFNSVEKHEQAQHLIEGVPLSFAEAFLCLHCDFLKPYFKEAKIILESDKILEEMISFYKHFIKK